MATTTENARARRLLNLGTVVGAVGVLGLAMWLSRQLPPTSGESLPDPLRDGPRKAIEEVLGFAKLLISWSLAIVGGNAFFLKSAAESKLQLRSRDLLFFEVSAFSALVSVLLGCQAISNAILVLHLNQDPVGNDIVDPYVRWQYRALVVAAIVLVVAVHQFFWRVGHDGS